MKLTKEGIEQAIKEGWYTDYLLDRSEINARFGEAILLLRRMMPISKSDVPDAILSCLDKNQLIDIFPLQKNDPKVKRLINRAYLYYDAENDILLEQSKKERELMSTKNKLVRAIKIIKIDWPTLLENDIRRFDAEFFELPWTEDKRKKYFPTLSMLLRRNLINMLKKIFK